MDNVLIVDDDDAIGGIIATALAKIGYSATRTTSQDHAVELIGRNAYDIVITELKTPQLNGIGILEAAREQLPDAAIIIIVDYSVTEIAQEAMEQGAWDYVIKPISLQQLSLTIDRALEKKRLAASEKQLREQVMEKYAFEKVVASSGQMLRALDMARAASKVDTPLLITGESGTGKQLMACVVHTNSARGCKPFISVDLSVTDQGLMEQILFGSTSGAVTGHIPAKSLRFSRKGAVAAAHNGTLFLNEITAATPGVQERLLELLECSVASRVGSDRMSYVDVRLIVTSSVNVADAVKHGKLRADLLSQFSRNLIHLPPLRERKDDIPPLTYHFVSAYSSQSKRQMPGISPEFLSSLMVYDWPGNVRELKNAVEHAVASTCEGEMLQPITHPTTLATP